MNPKNTVMLQISPRNFNQQIIARKHKPDKSENNGLVLQNTRRGYRPAPGT